jgi:hypothetical protein
MRKMNERNSGLMKWLGVGAVFAGSIFVAEKTGVSDAFVQGGDLACRAFYKLHHEHPLLFWGDYGDPEVDPVSRLTKYRIGYDAGLGAVGVMVAAVGISIVDDRRRKKYESER